LVLSWVISKKLNTADAKAEQAKRETAAIAEGVKALLRDRLLQGYKHYIEKGWADMDDRSNMENVWRQYHALGGNGDMNDEFTEYQSTVTAATCTTSGTDIYKCKHCNATKQVTVAAKGHKEVTDAAVEATCTKTGLTAGSHCSVCTDVLVAQQVVPAKGHKEVTDAAVEATCTETGLTAGSHCSVCKDVLVAQQVVPAKGHKEVTDAAVEATCTETGLTAGSHCSACGTVTKAKKVVPAKGHSPAAAVKENEKAAKIGVAGSYDEVVYCKDCGAEISRKTVTVPAVPEEKKEEDVKNAETATDKAEITAAAATVDTFDAFCNELVWKIRNAAQNGTVEADAGNFPGLKQNVFGALNDRPDVSLKLKTRDGEITIPAGAGLLSKVSRGVVTWAEIRGLV